MAISIDYIDPSSYVINVPRADMTLIASIPTEIRQLNIDSFRQELGDLQDNSGGVWADTAFEHTPPLTISGVTLARVVRILDPYTLTFEDGLYNVNIVGGNSNLADVVNKNQVGVNTANSAGLQDPFALQAGAFGNEVSVSVTGLIGTEFPKGTRAFPVANLSDALAIAELRGIARIHFLGDYTFNDTDFSAGYVFTGDSTTNATLTLNAGTDITNCTFEKLGIIGVLDGANTFLACEIYAVTGFTGQIIDTGIIGPITLGSGGGDAELVNCHSEKPGSADSDLAVVDFDGANGIDLFVRGFHGGLKLINCSRGSLDTTLDLDSGHLTIDATVSAGTITVRGVSTVEDNSTGSTVVSDQTLTSQMADLGEEAAYTDALVVIDVANGSSGTIYPAGTLLAPVDNWVDAESIRSERGLLGFRLDGPLTLGGGEDSGSVRWTGRHGRTDRVTFAGGGNNNSSFRDVGVAGALVGLIRAHSCHIADGVTGFKGGLVLCGVQGTLTFDATATGTLLIERCHAHTTAGTILDLNGCAADVSIRSWHGPLTIVGLTGGGTVGIDMDVGSLTIDASCTNGTIAIRGTVQVTDNSAGTTVVDDTHGNSNVVFSVAI